MAGVERHVVHPAIPILFFGDRERYLDSPVRIITVGLNPSHSEFPADERCKRFPAAARLSDADTDAKLAIYLEALSAYFREAPYRRWFNASFEKVLSGMEASYYCAPSIALHTDLCSPLATFPTWAKLSRPQRDALGAAGMALWHDLVDCLDPDIVLLSIRRAYLDCITFKNRTPWKTVYMHDRRNPYHVEAARFRLHTEKEPLFVWGRAAQLPFGLVNASVKCEIGTCIRTLHEERCLLRRQP